MKHTMLLAAGLACIGLTFTAPVAHAMPAAPEHAIAIQSDAAGVTAAHWTGYYHRHAGYYRPYYGYRPHYGYRRPYYGYHRYGWRGRGYYGHRRYGYGRRW